VNPSDPDFLEPDTVLLIPTAGAAGLAVPEGVTTVLEEDHEIEVLWTPLTDGRKALLAFTNEDELREWRPEGGHYVGLEAAEVLRMAFESAFVDVVYVNAYNRDGKVFVIPRDDAPVAG
jgi:hypothetical protein